MGVIKDSILYNIGNFIYLGAQWVISIALVRMGGFEDAGYFSLAMTVCSMFSMVANYGLRSFQVSDINSKFSNNTFILTRIVTVILSFILCVAYSFISGYESNIVLLICIYMIYKCIESFSDVLNGIWQKNGDMLGVSFSLGLKGILNLISFILFYVITKNITTSVLLMVISSLIILLFFDLTKTKKYISAKEVFCKIDYSQIFLLLKFGFITMLFVVLSTVFTSIPRLFIDNLFGAKELGIFSSIYTPTVIISTFAAGIFLPVAPKIAENYNQKDIKSIYKLIIYCNLTIIIIGIICAVLSFLFGKWAFELLFGEEILKYFSLFYLLIIAIVLIAIINCYSTVLIAIRKLNALVVFSFLSCILATVFSLIFIKIYGIYGAAYEMIISLIIQFIAETIYIIHILKNTKEPKTNK